MASKVGVFVRMAELEREALKAAAERGGLSMESWARGILLQAARGDAPTIVRSVEVGPLPAGDVVAVSRSRARRIAIQKGQPVPTFKGAASAHGPHCQCLACRGRAS